MRSVVVGGAGFIGSHLVDKLVQRGPVLVVDNFSSGRREFLKDAWASGLLHLEIEDVSNLFATEGFKRAVKNFGPDVVFHFAANPEARRGLEDPSYDLRHGTIATYNVLEACRLAEVPKLVFASSGTVYGDNPEPCAEEDLGRLPYSLYGASKLAGESMIASYVECFGLTAYICRFGNVVGSRATHGAIYDFHKRLKADPTKLVVLGNGSQSKPYLHVSDCVAGVLFVLDNAPDKLNIYNIAPMDTCSVKKIAEWSAEESVRANWLTEPPPTPIEYGVEPKGWLGDVPVSRLSSNKLGALGFSVSYSSERAVDKAILEVWGG